MKFLDLFAGIGGFRLGMERAGHKCIGFCEIDKFARASYKAIHDTKGEIELHDITAVRDEFIREIGSVDIICGGFPCQAFSTAGNRRGFDDTRGTLFFDIARFASILRPRYLFLENVKGLLNHEGGTTFETIISTLDELGYNVEWQVLNSKDFGVPQNRERVFIIGHLRGAGTRPLFPFGGESRATHSLQPKRLGNLNPSGRGMNGEIYQADSLAPTVTTNKGEGMKIAIPVLSPSTMQGGQEPKIIQKARGYNKGGEHTISPTLSSHSWQENNMLKVNNSTLSTDFYIRKLTPKECWRLQGFPDWAFDRAQAVNSNSQLYKQAGNSVTVNVIEAIAKKFNLPE